MFEEVLQKHEVEIVSAPAKSQERKRNLVAGLHWATDAIHRVNDEIRQTVIQFRRHKAEENLPLADDEKPHEIQHQIRTAAIYRAGGWSAIFAEILIATITILLMFSSFELSPVVSGLLAFAIATVLTLLIARPIHAALLILGERVGNPLESRARVRKWFIRPSFILVVLTIVAYIAIQRLDADTLLAIHPIVSGLMFVGMLGFVFLGASLLVLAALLSWSRPAAGHYEELLTRRELIAGKQAQWQEEYEEFEVEVEELSVDRRSPSTDREPSPLHETGGELSLTASAATKAAALLLTASVLFGASACGVNQSIKAEPLTAQVTMDLAVDASGVHNVDALKQAGKHTLQNVRPIVEQQGVTIVRVNWFGPNGWSTKERLNIKLPSPPHFVSNRTDAGEVGKLRRDVGEAQKAREAKAVAEATSKARNQYICDLTKSLEPLSAEALIPGPEVQSPCTDINGVFARFTSRTSVKRQLVAIITDGRQNCGTDEIKPVPWQKGVAVVIIVVPGTESDGFNDYESHKSKFTTACPWCVIVPYHREDIDAVIAEAVTKSETYTPNK